MSAAEQPGQRRSRTARPLGANRGNDSSLRGVLDEHERSKVQTLFGVAAEQVVRDHAISHALAAIGSVVSDDVVFFGGTALARTHLSDVRLSEDIDLIARGDRREIGDRIEDAITRSFRRAFGRVSFTPRIRSTDHPAPSVMQVADIRIQIQLLSCQGYPDWPTELVDIEQRYSDAPPARMRVLTAPAFVASKLASWNDRGASRDLYDLWALAKAGKIDAAAAELFGRHGPYTGVSGVSFERLPSESEWRAALAHQCRVSVNPKEAAEAVIAELATVGDT
ncbi:nucleotidyl transferase AbiEii/AbiGii toxin family protein [Microbacterium marinilacus]|uniref:Nucleotidyl transferase AbiEii/AbiGii toxin family protein n=1 Tax=Microbacterium marinilacus TaxID=415209 RepID=A0ABP7BI85_9MICO|nr:nucleotidyl transferase AbiEii/AbiGii toxin family protein [Microbacterium marinilacus]MBY0687702.1 nucleotidyl transferase AbiEii/AbiGii toxin family protein [Microbacterium marinilacus]